MVDYLLEGIEFSEITILDAATGAGNTTLKLARKMAGAQSTGKIVSVDVDPETFPDVKKKLGDLSRYVEFVQADLTSMPEIESERFDLVVCTATLCALNSRPLGALKGLAEFHRVLKKGGHLRISEEYPLPRATKPEEEVQVLHWQLYKSVSELIGEDTWREIYPEELEFAAKLVGFTNIEWRRFDGGPLRKATMEEWREVLPPLVNKIEDEEARKAILYMIKRIYRKFE
jgi:ubiquinone/menaquinone biosynthesis C-methylase UbiE